MNTFIMYYQADTFGNVWSMRNDKILKPNLEKYGYYRYKLSVAGNERCYLEHRLVALAFIPNPGNKPEINHLNGIKTDNRVENLEWCTRKENIRHALDTGLAKGSQKGKFGKEHNRSKPIYQYSLSGELIGEYCSLKSAMILTGICNVGICSALNGRVKTAGGFVWRYKDEK